MIPRIRHRHKTLLVVTDSQSLLAALNKGPLSQTDWTEDQIWQRLLTLTCAGWSVHLQFCYGHCGVHANELADQYATQTMETGQYTEHGIAPLWHTDLLTCLLPSSPTSGVVPFVKTLIATCFAAQGHPISAVRTRPLRKFSTVRNWFTSQGQGAGNLSSGADYTGP
ncbi:putative RNase H [Trypanosoma cruzi]|uniref:Putative RNase H n=1 Tax=Trypanosoma cruzi TaxID=5693 RepID=A0A2V2X5B0_TRYCR|nr:putative RNase H [Trypanosoma cruzi]